MYKFSIWDFNDKEIDQIVAIVVFSSQGNPNDFIDINGVIDRRKVSKNVFVWAKNWGLIAQGKDIVNYKGELPHWVKNRNRWYIYTGNGHFDALHCVPSEAIWRIISPILKEHKGFYSIISDKRWVDLCVWNRGSKEWDRKNDARVEYYNDHRTFGESVYLPKMYDYLGFLALKGYIIFQHAGDIWRVEIIEGR